MRLFHRFHSFIPFVYISGKLRRTSCFLSGAHSVGRSLLRRIVRCPSTWSAIRPRNAFQPNTIRYHCYGEFGLFPTQGIHFFLLLNRKISKAVKICRLETSIHFLINFSHNSNFIRFQANPGSWLLRLREGKSKEIYKISNHFNSERTEGEAVRVLIGLSFCFLSLFLFSSSSFRLVLWPNNSCPRREE